MPEFIAIVEFVLLAYALVDIIATEARIIRNLPKLVWLPVVILVPVVGPLSWLALGRPRGGSLLPGTTSQEYALPRRDRRDSRQPLAPDDDPDFLRRLGDPRDDR